MIAIRGVDVEPPKEVTLATKNWIRDSIELHVKKTGEVFFLFCSDAHLIEMNKSFLNHDYFTDVITFDLSEDEDIISGEIYISLDRVLENATLLDVSYTTELHRVMIHGILHLIGFDDKTEADIRKMRAAEEKCLSLHL